jgi:hypothetical protein
MIATVAVNPALTNFKSELLAVCDVILREIYIPENKENIEQVLAHQRSKAMAIELFDRRSKAMKAKYTRNYPALEYHFENLETLITETFVNQWYNIQP